MKASHIIVGSGLLIGAGVAYNAYQAAGSLTYLPKLRSLGWENDGPVLFLDVQVTNPSRWSFNIAKPGLSLVINGQYVATATKGVDRVHINAQSVSVIENIKINFSLVQAAIAAVPILSNLIYNRPLTGTTIDLQVSSNVYVLFLSVPISVTVDLMKALGNTDGLGYALAERREIKEGSEFDKFFPKAENSYTIVRPDGTLEDTIKFMGGVIDKWHVDTKLIAEILKQDTIHGTCENIWDFCTSYLHYKPDKKGVEELRSPKKCWYDGQVLYRKQKQAGIPESQRSGVDCDCFSIFIGTILKNLRIPFSIRITDYGEGYQHVYVVVNSTEGEIIIDPVYFQFNREKIYNKQISINGETLSDMKIAILNGTELSFEELTKGFNLAEIRQWEIERLIQLRDEAIANPETVLAYGYHPSVYLQCINYLIEYWNTSSRNEALDIVTRKLYEHNPNAGTPVLNGYQGLGMDVGMIIDLGKGIVDFFVQLFKGPKKATPTDQDKQAVQSIGYQVAGQVSAFFRQVFTLPNFTLNDLTNARTEAMKLRQTLRSKLLEYNNKFEVNPSEIFAQVMAPVESYFSQLDSFITQLINLGPTAVKDFHATVYDLLNVAESPTKLSIAKTQAETLKVCYGPIMGLESIKATMLMAMAGPPGTGITAGGRGGTETVNAKFAKDKNLVDLLERIMAAPVSGTIPIPPIPVFNSPVNTGGSSSGGGSGPAYDYGSGKGTAPGKDIIITDTPPPTEAKMSMVPMILLGGLVVTGIVGYFLTQNKKPKAVAIAGIKRKARKHKPAYKVTTKKKKSGSIPVIHLK